MAKVKCVCKQCDNKFEVFPFRIKRGDGKFCSRECYGKWQSKHYKSENSPSWRGGGIKRICQQCGKEFKISPHKINKGYGKFCSIKCRGQSQKKREKRICQQCGKEFREIPSVIRNGGGKFCSKKCRYEGRTKVKQICEQCGKEFEVYPSKINKGIGKFCSRKCVRKSKKGEANPAWKGGISFEPYCTKFNFAFKEYIRDKFGRVCFLCSKTEEENGERLSVHHVNYDKECMCNDNLTCQFVPLCRSCNSKINGNRKEWEAKIKAMMRNKLNGWYI